MKICVFGLWHLGTVTAACLAGAGYRVVGLDFDDKTIARLKAGDPPILEPGLEVLVKDSLRQGRLGFTTDIKRALDGVEIVWVTYDTPVDEEDRADTKFVVERIERLFPHLPSDTLVLISSQLPVGTTRHLEERYAEAYPDNPVSFACSPENLRLGRAISVFTNPDRIVAGVRSKSDRDRLYALLGPFAERIEWMSVESAEMTKHAINSFLAVSVTFANEVATLCEQVGADAKEVEQGLKSETRIGPGAYLSPGVAFSGGTLARDIAFLTQIGKQHSLPTQLLSAVKPSNDTHRNWVPRKLQSIIGDLKGQCIAIWGLTYKPGTDTLRRSGSVELCLALAELGARVQAHDPAIKKLPDELAQKFIQCDAPEGTLSGAAALVVATEWPQYRSIIADAVVDAMSAPVVIDPNRFLFETLDDPRIRYFSVGSPSTRKGSLKAKGRFYQ